MLHSKGILPGEMAAAVFCLVIGAAEVFHLGCAFGVTALQTGAYLWGAFACLLILAGAALIIRNRGWMSGMCKVFRKAEAGESTSDTCAGKKCKSEAIFTVMFAACAAWQLYRIFAGNIEIPENDMTLETVRSFLQTNGIYTVNPLTGDAYTAGIPLRIRILCLPGMYGFLCSLTGLDPEFAVCRLVPAVVLVLGYWMYGLLAGVLFPEDRTARAAMLFAAAFLYQCGDYLPVMDGFLALHCGFTGTAIRNCVLFPFALYLCLQKKWAAALLCICAEACIVWTLYGLGVCAFVTAGLWIVFRLSAVTGSRADKEGGTCRSL